MNYRFAYSIGFHPWEDAANDPPFVDKLDELIGREESGRSAPFGTALDSAQEAEFGESNWRNAAGKSRE
jgi:hypothetical protein